MAYTVDWAFRTFHNSINLSGDHRSVANSRKDWIVKRLRANLTVLDAFTIGSIPRYTALSGHADLDVLVVLHWTNHLKDRLPSTVLQNVKTALGAGAGKPRRNGQAVTMNFTTWPAVDVVPAARYKTDGGAVDYYAIPDMNREIWLRSRPRLHGRHIAAEVADSGSKFREIIKMLKHWNRRQDVRLQSYHIEVIALQMTCGWDDYSWSIYKWFEAAIPAVKWCWHESEDVSGYLSFSQANRAQARLIQIRDIANQAWYADYSKKDAQRSITLWKSIFGQQFPAYG